MERHRCLSPAIRFCRYYRATLDGRPMQVHDVPARPGFADHRILGAWLEIGSSWETRAQLAVPLHFGHNSLDPPGPG